MGGTGGTTARRVRVALFCLATVVATSNACRLGSEPSTATSIFLNMGIFGEGRYLIR